MKLLKVCWTSLPDQRRATAGPLFPGAGLTPLLLEGSVSAQFLIPMATSLAFGVVFASSISLFLVPSLYLILEDVKHGASQWIESMSRSLRSA